MTAAPQHSSVPHILLVDDDPILRELAAAKLVEVGYRVSTAENGEEAYARLMRDDFSLVIADIEMPVMDGFELTKKMRARGKHRETPVIVVTGCDHSDAVEGAFAAGATSFLTKPINWTLFTHSVRFVLRAGEDRKALQAARDAAEAGANAKDSLLSMMNHELRTPLNAIIGFGQLLDEVFAKQNDTLHQEYSNYIVAGGKRLLNTISNMLLVSEAYSGRMSINEDYHQIGDIIDFARNELKLAAKDADANIKLAIQEPRLEVYCDADLVARAISNLVENAIKFSDKGVEVMIGAILLQTGELAILVKDNGPGIDDETLTRAMAPFSQRDMSSQRKKEGVGLGLPVTLAIAENHGASFKLRSADGGGVQAAFVLPKERVSEKTADARASA